MLLNVIIATIRTVVPLAVGTGLAFAARRWGVVIPEDLAAAWTVGLVNVLATLYYVLVSFLERRVDPAFGWLLGSATAPSYPGLPSDGYEDEL